MNEWINSIFVFCKEKLLNPKIYPKTVSSVLFVFFTFKKSHKTWTIYHRNLRILNWMAMGYIAAPNSSPFPGLWTSFCLFRTQTYSVPCHTPQKSCLVIAGSTVYSPYDETWKGVLLIQFSGRPQKTHRGTHSSSCFNNKNKLAKGKRRAENCQDLWQVNISYLNQILVHMVLYRIDSPERL